MSSKSSRHLDAERKVLKKLGKKGAQRRWLMMTANNWDDLFAVFVADDTGLVFPPRESTETEAALLQTDKNSLSAASEGAMSEPTQCFSCGRHVNPGEGIGMDGMDVLEHRRRCHEQKNLLKKHLAEEHGMTWQPTLPPVFPLEATETKVEVGWCDGPALVPKKTIMDPDRIILYVEYRRPYLGHKDQVSRVPFDISKDQYLGKLFDRWCDKMRVQPERVRFVIDDGCVINGALDTSKKLFLKQGDIIKAVVEEAVVEKTSQNNTSEIIIAK